MLQIKIHCSKCGIINEVTINPEKDPVILYCGNCSFILYQIQNIENEG